VNDIDLCFRTSRLLCFADDMKIFAKIRNIGDAKLLHEDLNRFGTYCIENKLGLNPSKCSVITFSRKLNRIAYN
jgi:hypothetical protein